LCKRGESGTLVCLL
nr:immunoglobulin heavy chain junction region [Mus musculus]